MCVSTCMCVVHGLSLAVYLNLKPSEQQWHLNPEPAVIFPLIWHIWPTCMGVYLCVCETVIFPQKPTAAVYLAQTQGQGWQQHMASWSILTCHCTAHNLLQQEAAGVQCALTEPHHTCACLGTFSEPGTAHLTHVSAFFPCLCSFPGCWRSLF